MFTAQDILDIAIRLENASLKSLLTWIAEEERAHANWFSQLKDRLEKGEDHHLMAELSRALVEDVVQGQTFSLHEVDFETINTSEKMIRTFIGFEDDTIAFYEILKGFIDNPTIAGQMEQIIEEEKKHMVRFRELLSER